jgi:hypothetical protein
MAYIRNFTKWLRTHPISKTVFVIGIPITVCYAIIFIRRGEAYAVALVFGIGAAFNAGWFLHAYFMRKGL